MSQVVDENSNPNISISKEIDQNIKPASNVFGSILDGDDVNSLCYSPSPVFGRKKSKRFTFEEDIDEIQQVQVKDNPITEDTKPIQTKNEKPRRARSPLRSRSPIRQDLLDKAQAAIDSANFSVNSALNKVRKAKEEADSEKKREIAKLREERKQEKERAMALQAEAEKKKRELLHLKRQAISKHSKTKVERQRLQNKAKMSVVEEEIQFKSSVYRAHKNKQKEEENRRKRISMAVRADIRKNNREGQERLRMARIQEDNIHFEERHGSSVAAEKFKKDEADRRRISLFHRNGIASRNRKVQAEMEQQKLDEEHESYELKWAGEKDAEEYRKQMAEERRASLAFRHQEGKRQRDVDAELQSQRLEEEHESYELKWAGEKDAEEYVKQMAEERRMSFAFRHEEGKRHREVMNELMAIVKEQETESYILKWAGEKDAEEYGKQMAEERRMSYAFRNEEGKRQRELEVEQHSDELADEHESYELKWAGEKDAEAHQRQMAEERRASLEFRHLEGKRQRDLAAEQHSDELADEHESYELKWAGEKDAEAHRRQLAEERRASLEFRHLEGKRQRDLAAEQHSDELADEHESYELKWAGEKDAEAHRRQMAEERRASLEFRHLEGKRQRDLEAELQSQRLEEEHESYELKWAGEKDAEAHKRQLDGERRASLEFRHLEGKRQRDLEAELQSQKLEEEHESYELKWAGEKDAEAHQRQMAEERRMSYAFRNEEGKRQRELKAEQHSDKLADEHESYELKWAGEKDAEAHRRQMAEERRASLEFRHLEGKRQRDLAAEQHSDELADEHESYELKWAGEKDVERYRAEEEQKKRESLQLRNHEGKIHREIDAQIQSDMIEERAQDERLQAACRRDVENYRRECAERDRASLMFRRGEAKIQRMEENMRQLQELELEEVNRELDALAREDVKLYVKECKERRRMSLAVRAAEKKRHRKWEKENAEIVRQERSRDTQDRALDSQYVQLAKDNERAAIALDAIRHHDCSFSSNPFASLLG